MMTRAAKTPKHLIDTILDKMLAPKAAEVVKDVTKVDIPAWRKE